jgi:RNA-directed DNA polymerase
MPIFPRYTGPLLMEQVCRVENLTLAWRRVLSNIQVARRGRSAGPDAVTLRDFEADWTRQMTQLADELRSGAYRAVPPRRVQIPKSSGGARAIAILTVRDRVAQRAVQQVLEPQFDPLLLDCSYGCRPRVGVADAVARVARYAEQGLTWVVDADIQSYFDMIDQRILLGLVRQRIDESALLQLIAQWLEVGALEEAESAPLAAPEAWPARWGQTLRRVVGGAVQPPPAFPPAGGPTAPDLINPYAAAGWEQPGYSAGWNAGMPVNGLEQHVWTAMMFAKPVINGARMAWPYVRKIGGQRLAMAGTVAAVALAAGEAVRRGQAAGPRGTPQGGALSPLLANIYLHPFDLALTSQGVRLVRFVDDFVIMCASQAEAERALTLAQQQLATLRLTLHPEKTQIASYADGLAFLGQALAPRRSGPRLAEGLTSFEQAQAALRAAAGNVRRRMKR